MKSDSEIKIDTETGIMQVSVNLKCPNPRVLCYGTFELAKEECARYFMIQELKKRQVQEKLGIITPNGQGPVA